MKSKLTWILASVLVFITLVGVVYVALTVSRQESKTSELTQADFEQYCADYGISGEDPYLDLAVLCADQGQDVILDSGICSQVEGSLPQKARLLELSQAKGMYCIDYALPGNDGVYDKRVLLSYWEDGTVELVIREGNRIITVNSALSKEIQYVS